MTSQSEREAYRGRENWRAVAYAVRFSEPTGKCRRASKKSTWRVKCSYGCPAMSVKGLAHGDERGQHFRGSMRGPPLAGRKPK